MIGAVIETENSLSTLLSQTNSADVLLNALYSASVEERETTGCFFDFQEIKQPPKNENQIPIYGSPNIYT